MPEESNQTQKPAVLNGTAPMVFRLITGALSWAVPFVIGWAFGIQAELAQLEARISIIESNRFTSQDALEVWRALDERPTRDEVPPRWFEDKFNTLEEEFKDHIRRQND